MRYLRFSLLIVLFVQCKSDYSALVAHTPDAPCAKHVMPRLAPSSLYQASIDVTGHHLSGLLVVKEMPDSSWRAVFTNEAGVTYVDLGLRRDGTYTVHHAVRQLNRRPVLMTLQKDFALMIGIPFHQRSVNSFSAGDEVYFGVSQKNESYYFITSKDCASLHRMERGSDRKKVVSIELPGTGYPRPSALVLQHHTFDMQINLNRIERE